MKQEQAYDNDLTGACQNDVYVFCLWLLRRESLTQVLKYLYFFCNSNYLDFISLIYVQYELFCPYPKRSYKA